MLLSIIIPIYNKEAYIKNCMESILSQLHFYSREVEVICVDDGSNDNSVRIVEEYSKLYDGVKLVIKENGGVSSARNMGLDLATGKYIAFIDPDDIVSPDYLEIVCECLRKNDIERLDFGFYTINGCDNKDKKEFIKQSEGLHAEFNDVNIWSSVFSNDTIQDNKIRFLEGITYGEDALFQFVYGLHCENSKKITNALYYYCSNKDSVTNQKTKAAKIKEVDDYIKICEIIKEAYDSYNFSWFRGKDEISVSLINMLRITLERVVYLPLRIQKSIMRRLKNLSLFPYPLPDDYPVNNEQDVRWAYGNTLRRKRAYCRITYAIGFWQYKQLYALDIIKTRIKARY